MGLVRAWRRQIYGASLVAILIPASIIVVLFALTGGGPLHGLGTLGQVFSGPAIPGGNLSARVSLSSKPALPGKGTVGAAALRGHSPVLGQRSSTPSSGSHGPAVAPVKVGTTAPSTPRAPSNGGQLHGGSGVGASGTGGNPPPAPPANTPTTTTTSSTTTSDGTTAASLPPIVAVPPPPVSSTSTTTPTTTTTTTTTTPVHTTTTTTTTRTTTTTTSTTRTTTTSTTRTTPTTTTRTTPTTKTTTTTTPTTPTTRTTTTTVTHTTTTIKPPTSKTATKPLDNAAPALATTVAQAERGSATFTGCSGNWGVGRSGHVEQIAPAASLHAASNGGTSTID